MPKFDAIVFDLDGTLVDSMTGFADIAAAVMAQYFGMRPHQAAVAYRQTSGLPFPFQLKSLFGEDARIVPAVKEFDRRKAAGYDARPFFKDAIECLPRLSGRGLKLFVSSNNDEANVRRKIDAHARHFSDVLGYRDGFLKGAAHFDFIRLRHGIGYGRLLFVGDSLHDARTAAACGVGFVARVGTFSARHFSATGIPFGVVRDFSELDDLIGGG